MYPYNLFNPKKQILPIVVNGYGLPGDDQRPEILEQIATNPSAELIIFDKSLGPEDNELEYLDWIAGLNLQQEFIVATSNYRYHFDKHAKIVHLPRYYASMLRDPNNQRPDITTIRPYPISCLTKNPWTHKTLNFVAMSKQPWFDQIQKSFGWTYPELTEQYNYLSTDVLNMITAQDADYLRSIYPLRLNAEDDMDKFESNACPTYQTCYIDYLPESRTENTFISEKTWKPIFSGQLFLILGSVGTIEYLRAIGVDVFDDIVDHAYDQEPNLETKIAMLMTAITNLLAQDLDQIWTDTYHRRQKNLDLVYSPAFQQCMFADIASRVS
jgi:hypothetical protein